MKPLRKDQLKYIIESAYLISLDNGERQELSTRNESYCHFFEPIFIDDYRINFRLDWADIDDNNHPTLDADFYCKKTGKKLANINDLYLAHHTKARDEQNRIFEWEFSGNKISFKIEIHWISVVEDKIKVSDCVTTEIFRNGIKVDE